jgi:hypothetical protein
VTLRHQGAMGKRETRTQEALVAALRARPRTPYRAARCVLVAEASIFNSLLGQQILCLPGDTEAVYLIEVPIVRE